MSDIVVTCPQRLWREWLDEGDLPGQPWSGYESHYWFGGRFPHISPGERVYVVAHRRLRGYAPLVRIEPRCELAPTMHCFVRRGGAVAVTIDGPIPGFQGWRYRWWKREDEVPFPDWCLPGGRVARGQFALEMMP
jgi:hypothetical protein